MTGLKRRSKNQSEEQVDARVAEPSSEASLGLRLIELTLAEPTSHVKRAQNVG